MADTSEKNLETIIVEHLRDQNQYEQGVSEDYNKDYALDTGRLEAFLRATQPEKVETSMCFSSPSETHKFLTRLQGEITKRGVCDVLRRGFRFNSDVFDLYYPLPSEQNKSALLCYLQNKFTVIRQLHHSKTNPMDSIDVVIFLNGLPLITMELKNHYTGQTVKNAIRQYQVDRDPSDPIFQFKRCAVHFAVDDTDIYMCTKLCGKDSWFLPFNKGVNGGAGNPVNPNGIATDYLWKNILTKQSLSNILENYAQVVVENKKVKNKKTGKKELKPVEKCIWPRYHQLDCVRCLLAATEQNGVGKRYLIQHSAGSGKSNSITWLAYQLAMMLDHGQKAVFDSVVVVTDRVNLDKQIRDNIRDFGQMPGKVFWAEDSTKLREYLQGGAKIIITTIHKFSFILDEIGNKLKERHFAIIIDEAHSSQNGAMSASMAIAVSGNAASENGDTEPEDLEDVINRIMKGRKMAKNANYYAFTATPKNKTLEMFGTPLAPDSEGNVRHVPFHEYTMKQAIEEGFILDVLKNYTPYRSFYRIIKATEDDPQFDKKEARSKLRAYVERQPETIHDKAAIIVEHFHTKVFNKIAGQARAMVVTSSINRAIDFYNAISKLLEERKSPFKAIVAFTDKEINGQKVTESQLNGFPSVEIEDRIEEDPYRILVVADKFQTGYDQPLLHTMYVDKQLSDVKAVQTLSRLNRNHPKKIDTFVLDFANEPEDIQKAFQKYYKTTILTAETDPNKLNDLISTIEQFDLYDAEEVNAVVAAKLTSEDRTLIDPVIDTCVARFKTELTDENQITCKSAIKNYNRIYPFIAAVVPFSSKEWEKLYVFYMLLVAKLPKIAKVDYTEGLIDVVDFDKYRIVKGEEMNISLEDMSSEIDPVPVGTGGGKKEPELDSLSNIIEDFNQMYGNIEWKNQDEVVRQIKELPGRISQKPAFVNAVKNSDEQTAQMQFNTEIQSIVAAMLEEKTEFVQHYFTDSNFRAFVNERVFMQSYNQLATAR